MHDMESLNLEREKENNFRGIKPANVSHCRWKASAAGQNFLARYPVKHSHGESLTFRGARAH